VSGVDPSILVIPALGTILPIAYATGATVRVPRLDRGYAEAADALAHAWRRIYPRFRPGFSLEADLRDNHPGRDGGSLLLFSGGLDSTATLLARQADVTALLTVWGADVELDDAELWGRLRTQVDPEFAHGRRWVRVRSNFRRFPVELTLVHDFLAPGDSWWARAHHGMGLIGLAAPAAAALGNRTVIVPASYSPACDEPNGSMPATDSLHRWGDTAVEHEGFELSRQGKIDSRLAPYLRAGGSVSLAVCYQPGRGAAPSGLNCGRCEKCLRTAAGLLAAGIEPTEVGLAIDDTTYRHWAEMLAAGHPVLHARARPFWVEVQDALDRRMPTGVNGAQREFLAANADRGLDTTFENAEHSRRLGDEMKY
ncbi:MAG: hypothetical protein LPK92_09295, partial [Actinomycetes bacterium]|nr:hypothetical protein [Actinomycetes bacterium]